MKINCAFCNTVFIPEARRGSVPMYCSRRCCNAAFGRRRRSTAEGRAKVAAMKKLRRARKKSAEWEAITPVEVYERDRWVCGICRGPIPKVTDDRELCATLDHVVPLSRGGGHLMSNVQASHWICNSWKSDRLTSELPDPEVSPWPLSPGHLRLSSTA